MDDRITIDPNIHFGKPCVRGTRIPVVAVLELVAEGIGFDQIRADYYPDLSVHDIQACIRFAIELTENEEIHVTATA
jgi:uncharacterized protein (DUF433 family)